MDLDETWHMGLWPEKTKPCVFPAKSLYGFRRESEKNGSQRHCFLSREWRTTSATFLGSISAKLSTNTCPDGLLRYVVSHSRKVSIKGSNFLKSRLLGHFRVSCLCPAYGSRERSATPRLFPSLRGHPTDLSFLCGFCWEMYRFPAIHVRTFPFATVSAMAKPGRLYFSNILARGRDHRIADLQRYTNYCTFSSFVFCVLYNAHFSYLC